MDTRVVTMKPLDDVVGVDLRQYAATADQLLDLPDTPGFARAEAFFADYPERSLAVPRSRAFMHCLVRAVRPNLFVEIGTYYAGTTEVAARAMLANDNGGQLLTIDPYGNHRVPGILETWPAPLREVVSYMPVESMTLFTQLNTVRPVVDVCFIDGNHLYEYAAFDLHCLARYVRPGGIIIMDDFDQPGVFWGTKHFLDLNPGWRELGGVFDAYDAHAPFESVRPSIEGTGFLVLAAPDHFEVGAKPAVFEHGKFAETAVEGFTVDVAPGCDAGTIHGLVFLRSFYDDEGNGDPEQLELKCTAVLSGAPGEQTVLFDRPLSTAISRDLSKREVELNLIWASSNGAKPLRLTRKPEPILAN